MIQTAQAAKEAIRIWDEIVETCAQKEIPIPDDEETTKKQMLHLLAKGYIAAFEGAEVKGLLGALEHFRDHCGDIQHAVELSEITIVQFKHAVNS